MKFTLTDLYNTPIRPLLLSSSKYKARLYVDLNLRTNNTKYILMTENGVTEFSLLTDAALAFKEHQRTQDRVFTASQPINAFQFQEAIFKPTA